MTARAIENILGEKQVQKLQQQLDAACESDVTSSCFVRFSWSDVHGIARGVTIPATNAKYFIENGYSAFAGKLFGHLISNVSCKRS